ncbi:MAG: acetyltransferase [Actinomycetota bacterium]|nr:acetyltransferase [Actinomycetota bacterium]MDQ3679688.1 acetyltransferase [Actinomycetota bacterium]
MQLDFRPLDRSDFPLLEQWLGAPHVEVWWREEHEPAAVEARYGPAVDGVDPTELFVVEGDGRPIGMIQRYRLSDDPQWVRALAAAAPPADAACIDYLIGVEALTGRGLGGEIIGRFVEDTWERYPELSAIVVPVQQANQRSWRALEKAGFERTWSGMLDSDDPSDEGPSHVYVRCR